MLTHAQRYSFDVSVSDMNLLNCDDAAKICTTLDEKNHIEAY